MKFLGTTFLVLLFTAFFGSAHAACGGGGYHSTRVTTTTDSQPIVSSSEASHVVSTSAQSTRDNYNRPADNARLDTSRLDDLAPRMHLSQKQWDRIQVAKQQVRDDQARAAQNQRSFSANVEFERRLQSILNADQLDIYLSNDRSR